MTQIASLPGWPSLVRRTCHVIDQDQVVFLPFRPTTSTTSTNHPNSALYRPNYHTPTDGCNQRDNSPVRVSSMQLPYRPSPAVRRRNFPPVYTPPHLPTTNRTYRPSSLSSSIQMFPVHDALPGVLQYRRFAQRTACGPQK
jgi:hypothetical protein